MLKYRVTLFESVKDACTDIFLDFSSWEEFSQFFVKASSFPYEDKHSAPLISPATYNPGTGRGNDNVVCWKSWAAIDIDSDKDSDLATWEDLRESLGYLSDYRYLCYSTASCRVGALKYRLIFSLDSDVPHDQISDFWHAINSFLNKKIDSQTKDQARIFFVPGTYAWAYNFIWVNNGEKDLNPFELIRNYPRPTPMSTLHMPGGFLEEFSSWKRNTLTNPGGISFSSYQDCPFVNQKTLSDYQQIISSGEVGRYKKLYDLMVSIAGTAHRKQYPLTVSELEMLVRGIDLDIGGGYYKNRNIAKEAHRALEYIFTHSF